MNNERTRSASDLQHKGNSLFNLCTTLGVPFKIVKILMANNVVCLLLSKYSLELTGLYA